jgi:hypothetical protein
MQEAQCATGLALVVSSERGFDGSLGARSLPAYVSEKELLALVLVGLALLMFVAGVLIAT